MLGAGVVLSRDRRLCGSRCRRSSPDSGGGLKAEAGYASEDAVVGDEWQAEAHRRGGDPAIGVVLTLSQSVARVGACGSEPGVGEDEFGSRVDDLDAPELGLELEHAGLAPAATQRAVPNLSLGLE